MATPSDPPKKKSDVPLEIVDVLCVGAGPVGFSLVAGLLTHPPLAAPLRVGVVEAYPMATLWDGCPRDDRTTTLSAHTFEALEKLGLWSFMRQRLPLDGMAADYVGDCVDELGAVPIQRIVVTDRNKPATTLEFDATTVGKPFGRTINNTRLRRGMAGKLMELAAHNPNLQLFDGVTVEAIETHPAAGMMRVILSDGRCLGARLLVGADGRRSLVRQKLAVDFTRKSYGQGALVGLVHHTQPHGGLAYEGFFPQGPSAFLPYISEEGATTTSAYVICGDSKVMEALHGRGKKDGRSLLQSFVRERLPNPYGHCKGVTPGQFYPLEIGKCRRVHHHRTVLIGDAAQYIHPVAGQGMNLGIRDALALTEKLLAAHTLGLDIGSTTVLSDYAASRHRDVWPMMGLTHGLVNLFGLRNPVAKGARGMGFHLVNRLEPVKSFFIKRAMGY